MDAGTKPETAGRGVPAGAPRLLDRVREAVRIRHYSFRTEECYIAWVRRFILFHNKRHPLEMGSAEFPCRTLWRANTPTPTENGPGNMCSQRPGAARTPTTDKSAGIIFTRR
jgi:hypothetical protein